MHDTRDAREGWLTFVFDISQELRPVLRRLHGKSIAVSVVTCGNRLTVPFALALSLTAHVACSVHIDPFLAMRIQTLSRRTVGISEANELKDMVRLLANLWETAQRLPEGTERQDAFRQIGSFYWRVAALVTRAL
jgi:hypothetical protein